MTARRRFSGLLLKRHGFRGGEEAFALPLVIPAALLLIMGAMTLMSRTTNSYLATTKQSDAQAARQAAESGMNRVLSALNPFAKFSTDPYLSFLLASRWQDNTGITYNTGVASAPVVRSGWRLTTLSRSAVQALLRQCGLSDRGQHPNQLPPSTETGYRDVLSGAIGPVGADSRTQLRYMVTDYVPPTLPPSSAPWPSVCSDFTSLSGGSAQISVKGMVVRNGRLVSSYTLTRTFDVQGWPLPNLPTSWLTLRINPGPPVGLRIAGTSTGLSNIAIGNFPNFSTDLKYSYMSGDSMPQCLRNCPDGKPLNGVKGTYDAVEMRVPLADIIPSNAGDLPRYPFNTNLPPSGMTPRQINESNTNYPYTDASSSTLASECRTSDTPDLNRPDELRPNEIDCWIESIGPASVLTGKYDKSTNVATITFAAAHGFKVGSDINVTIASGPLKDLTGRQKVETVPASNQITFKPPSPLPGNPDPADQAVPANSLVESADPISLVVNTESKAVNLIVRGNVGTPSNLVSIKHMVRQSPAQNFIHSISSVNVRSSWNRLRLFGRQATTSACAVDQTFYIRPDAVGTAPDAQEASLAGTFVWLPRGELVYGSAGQSFPQELLSVWWVCNLNVSAVPSTMALITPFHGNHDVVASVLPGGFISATGVYTPDLRFPVYPSLQRIRSAF